MAYPPYTIAGEPNLPRSSAPRATGGKVQPRSGGKRLVTPKKVDQRHLDAVARRMAKLHANAMQRYNAAHAAPAGPVTSHQSLVDALALQQFGPQRAALNAQLSQNARFTQAQPGWYAQATAEIRRLQQGANAGAQQTLGQITAYNSPATLNNPTDQQAADARNNLNAAFATKFGADANSNSAALDRIAAAMQIAQANEQGHAQLERMGLLGQQGQLAAQEGAFRTTTQADLDAAAQKQANADRTYEIQLNAAMNAGLLSKANYKRTMAALQKTENDNRFFQQHGYYPSTKDPNAPPSASERKTQAELDYFNQHGYWPPTGPPKPTKGGKGDGGNSVYSKSKIQGFRATWDFAREAAKQVKAAGTVKKGPFKGQPTTYDTTYSSLLRETKDPDIAKAAALAAFGKPIPAPLRHRLALKGIHPPESTIGRVEGGGPYGTGRMQ